MTHRWNVATLTLALALAAGGSAAWAADETKPSETQKVSISIPNNQCGNCVSAL
jgi:hypothetical protein